MRRHVIWGAALILVTAGIVIQLGRRSDTQPEHESPITAHADHAPYVGTQACVPCHRDISGQFQRSGMGQSWRAIEPLIASAFDSAQRVTHPAAGFTYRSIAADGHYLIEESRPESVHGTAHELSREVRFAVGSGKHAQAYVVAAGNYLTLAPINWYATTGMWDFNPGYERYNWRFDRPVLAECAGCHNGQATRVPGSVNQYQLPLADGIGCEACHGPGGRHVTEQSRIASDPLSASTIESTIVNPGRLEPARQNDVCFHCHLSTDVRWSWWAGAGDRFLPGQRLADHRADFVAEPDDPNAVGVASHAARMVQSRCYTATHGRLTCITCHDAHVPSDEIAASVYNARCADCHATGSCPAVEADQSMDPNCIGCHMPCVPASNAPHVVFTEHWIRARPPTGPLDAVNVKPKRSPGQPVRLTNFWSDDATLVEQGIAYLAYYDHHTEERNAADLRHGMARLNEAKRRRQTMPPQAEYWLGIGHGHLGQWSAAVVALEAASRSLTDPDLLADALARLGQAQQQVGNLQGATETYESLLRRFPASVASYEGLVPLAISKGQLDRAIELGRRSLELNRHQPTMLTHLAFALMKKDGASDEPIRLLDEAQRLDPDQPFVYFTRAGVLESTGDPALARGARRDAFCALARTSLVAGDHKAAVGFIDKAIEAAPDDADLVQWRRELAAAARP